MRLERLLPPVLAVAPRGKNMDQASVPLFIERNNNQPVQRPVLVRAVLAGVVEHREAHEVAVCERLVDGVFKVVGRADINGQVLVPRLVRGGVA
jgi:hypothetical protein